MKVLIDSITIMKPLYASTKEASEKVFTVGFILRRITKIKFFFKCFIEFNEKGYQYFKASAMIIKPSMNYNFYSSPIYSWLYQTLYNLLENHLNKQSPIHLEIKFITHTLLTIIGIEAYVFLRNSKYTIEQIKNNLYTIYLEPICNPV